MTFDFDTRLSDSPLVEGIWRTESGRGGSFISTAEYHWEMVVTQFPQGTTMTIRGPETKARPAPIPEDARFLGVVFKPGTFLTNIRPETLVDHEIDLPHAARHSFWLNGGVWQFPNFENIDTFINRLVRDGLLEHDPMVSDALEGYPPDMSLRTLQRRFRRATGLSQAAILQIERARHAMTLLQQGVSILDTMDITGFYDQPHLTRMLKRLMGQTPAQILRPHTTD